jgi:predicted nucleic acid-binding protein
VAANALDYFAIVVPRAVEAELFARQSGAPRREYPYATLFRRLRSQMQDPPADTSAPLPIFGAGEAEAIALAAQLHTVLLINEHRAVAYARSHGIAVVTVPEFVALCVADVISARAGRRKLDLIEPITAAPIITEARRALDLL